MVEFTKKQFLSLMKAVYLGNWMANAWRIKGRVKDYERIEDYIFSLAPRFGLDRCMDHEESDGDRYYPTSYFEEETDVDRRHEEYDEDTFWDELAERLGERDFFEKYSIEEIKKMPREERFTKHCECVDLVNKEIEKRGLKRMRITKSVKNDRTK
ncbi:hypothetical protein KKD61_02250 [Patescibacteria group bacterium]|nr:hypothetical protein [Patescibacteria group bacterium]